MLIMCKWMPPGQRSMNGMCQWFTCHWGNKWMIINEYRLIVINCLHFSLHYDERVGNVLWTPAQAPLPPVWWWTVSTAPAWSAPSTSPAASTTSGEHSSRAVKRSMGFTITEKAPTRTFFWSKASTSAFTFKTLCYKADVNPWHEIWSPTQIS